MCHKHPECQAPPGSGQGKHKCAPMARGSEQFVDRARDFARTLQARGKLLGHGLSRVKVTPFYDDCWAHRGRCQGHRPCQEPVDAAWTCRATAMLCPKGGPSGWPGVLAKAKSWIPPGHASASTPAGCKRHPPRVTPPPPPPAWCLPGLRPLLRTPARSPGSLEARRGFRSSPQIVLPKRSSFRLLPSGMLYLFDGQTSDLIDETFRTWGTHTAGRGSTKPELEKTRPPPPPPPRSQPSA